jgi:anhydro-N-acetylmuramic acid kinase
MRAELVRWHAQPYPTELRQIICGVRMGECFPISTLARLGREISLCYAAGVNEALRLEGLGPADLAAVAAHGQTLFHDPPNTIQWLDPALVAVEVGCAVISDFRRADCAAGGQGAPLVPFADYLLFRHPAKSRVLLNIGGIANLTFLPAGGRIDDLIAFDTGPGNCVSDFLVRRFNAAEQGYDEGGKLAGEGKPIETIVGRVLSDSYFSRRPPKSTDGKAMIELSMACLGGEESPANLLSTACAITAGSIADGIGRFLKTAPDEIFVSGGGVRNRTIMQMLRQGAPCEIKMLDDLGVPASAKEAMAFALLGAATLDGVPANVPAATGARMRVILGSITPKS